jgi:hypothetical protein
MIAAPGEMMKTMVLGIVLDIEELSRRTTVPGYRLAIRRLHLGRETTTSTPLAAVAVETVHIDTPVPVDLDPHHRMAQA